MRKKKNGAMRSKINILLLFRGRHESRKKISPGKAEQEDPEEEKRGRNDGKRDLENWRMPPPQ